MNSKLVDLVDVYIDDLIIVAAYENYLKAKLLIYGYVIHKIDTINDALKKLANQQKRKPIEIKHIPSSEKRLISKSKMEEVFTSLKKQTIDISNILGQKKYCDSLNLPSEISKKLSQIVRERNKIHYWVVQLTNLSTSRFENIKMLSNYLSNDVNELLLNTEEHFEKLRSGSCAT